MFLEIQSPTNHFALPIIIASSQSGKSWLYCNQYFSSKSFLAATKSALVQPFAEHVMSILTSGKCSLPSGQITAKCSQTWDNPVMPLDISTLQAALVGYQTEAQKIEAKMKEIRSMLG